MSIFSDLFHGRITWQQAAAKVGIWETSLISKAPAAFQPAITAAVSDVKQGLSDGLSLADTASGTLLTEFLSTGVPLFETALAAATHGLSSGFNPLISDGLDRLGAAAHAALDAAILEAKGALASGAVANPPAS